MNLDEIKANMHVIIGQLMPSLRAEYANSNISLVLCRQEMIFISSINDLIDIYIFSQNG